MAKEKQHLELSTESYRKIQSPAVKLIAGKHEEMGPSSYSGRPEHGPVSWDVTTESSTTPGRISVPIKADNGVELPSYETPGSVGMDLRASMAITLQPAKPVVVPTGLRVAIPEGYELQIRSRSGMALSGIVVANAPGTIDSDYRGEVGVILRNTTPRPFVIERDARIAQAVLCPVARCEWVQVEELEETERGEGGFGSTGKE